LASRIGFLLICLILGQSKIDDVWPTNNPFHYAFTFTFFGSLWVVLALMGCRLRKSDWSIVACRWADSPWWSEVGVGVVMLFAAAFFWKRALRTAC
jgi:hypothetical protein